MSMLDPLFILAPPRSFTSLVCACVGQHPELLGLPELNLFQADKMEDFWSGREPDGQLRSPFWAVMRHGMLRTVAQFYSGEQTIQSVNMAERWIKTRRDRTSGEVYRELAEYVAPLRIVEKSPGYLRGRVNLERLIATFPNARFIHLLRHPRGQCESLMNAKGGQALLFMLGSVDRSGEEPVLDPQILWHDANVRILDFLEDLPPERSIQVRGEAFLNDMDATLARICDWLGVRGDAQAIEAMKHPEDSPFSHVGPINARLGNDINFLNAPALRPGGVTMPTLAGPLDWRPDGASFHPRVAEMAREFGYE
ncbi:MAG: sulfotransferase [Alphaproteobacteria bacterium]|nr:sulfotransferase [Alphaproteobacteria bacterium]